MRIRFMYIQKQLQLGKMYKKCSQIYQKQSKKKSHKKVKQKKRSFDFKNIYIYFIRKRGKLYNTAKGECEGRNIQGK